MKYRAGFVSNSSSSSFICDLTGQVESGYDASLSDCGMIQCLNGHTILEGLKLSPTFDLSKATKDFVEHYNKPTWRKDELFEEEVLTRAKQDEVDDWDSFFECVATWDEEYGGSYGYGYPKEFCPICMMQDLPMKDIHDYFMKKTKQNHADLVKEIREKFNGNYDEFVKNIR